MVSTIRFQGLSIGMEGGIKRYLVTRLDYGSGFNESLMDSILVHLMLIEKRDNLPLGLAHDGCVMCCHLGFFHFGSTKGEGHGGDLHTVRYSFIGFI